MTEILKDYICIDLNGTLIAEDSPDGAIPLASAQRLRQAIWIAKAANYCVGLCSDSPLPELLEYADRLGCSDFAIAENGNVFYEDGQTVVTRTLPDRAFYIEHILGVASSQGYRSPLAVIAQEFGGTPPNYEADEWGLGAHRETSLTVFAPQNLITAVGRHLGTLDQEGVSIDVSPEYYYLAVHPGTYTMGKGLTLAQLRARAGRVFMVGNSMSDWVPPATGVDCAFVAEARISPMIASQAWHVSNELLADGVTDSILRYVAQHGQQAR